MRFPSTELPDSLVPEPKVTLLLIMGKYIIKRKFRPSIS